MLNTDNQRVLKQKMNTDLSKTSFRSGHIHKIRKQPPFKENILQEWIPEDEI